MSLTAMWIHGNAVIVETPQNLASDSRVGFGADLQLRAGTSCWVHAPIPTPVVLRGKRAKLLRVIILFTTGAQLQDVHIFDASSRMHTISTLQGGQHLTVDDANRFAVPLLDINFGLGVSMQWVHLGAASPDIPPQQVFIAAVGADFEIAD